MHFPNGTGQTPVAIKTMAVIGVIGMILCIYSEIGEYKMREEFIVLTEQGIEYTYSKKNKTDIILWKDIQKIRCVEIRKSRNRIPDIDIEYEKKMGGTGYLCLEYALESKKEIYEQMIRFWETYR